MNFVLHVCWNSLILCEIFYNFMISSMEFLAHFGQQCPARRLLLTTVFLIKHKTVILSLSKT